MITSLTVYSQNFTVKGKLSGINIPTDISLNYHGKTLSQISNDGTFEFKGSCVPPVDAVLKVIPHHPTLTMADTAYWSWLKPNMHLLGTRSFFLEGDVTIKGTVADAVVDGGKQRVYESFRAQEAALKRALDSLIRSQRGNDNRDDDENAEETVERVPSAAEKQLLKQMDELKLHFVEQNPDSYFSLNLAQRAK